MSKLLPPLKKPLCGWAAILGGAWTSQAQPALQVQSLDRQNIQLSWPSTAAGLVLEEAVSLGPDAAWQEVTVTPQLKDNRFMVSQSAVAGMRFFRLHLPSFATIRESSPVNGETKVAVLRETIVRFTAPLAPNSVVSTTN